MNVKLIYNKKVLSKFKAHNNIIEGDALDDAKVLGVVTFMVKELPRGDGQNYQEGT